MCYRVKAWFWNSSTSFLFLQVQMNATSGGHISLESICSCRFQRCPVYGNISSYTWTFDLSESFVVFLEMDIKIIFYCSLGHVSLCYRLLYFLLTLIFNWSWRIKSKCWVHSLFEVGAGVLWCTDCHCFQWPLWPWSCALAELICFSTFRAHGKC